MNEIYSGYDIKLIKEENKAYKGKILKVEGNSYQKKRKGYNKLKKITDYIINTNNEATYEKIDDYVKVVMPETPSQHDGIYINTAKTDLTNYIGQKAYFSFYAKADGDRSIMAKPAGENKYYTFNLTTNWQRFAVPIESTVEQAPVFYCGTTLSTIAYYIKEIMFEPGEVLHDYEEYGASPSLDFVSKIISIGENENEFDLNDLNVLYSNQSSYLSIAQGIRLINSVKVENECFNIFKIADVSNLVGQQFAFTAEWQSSAENNGKVMIGLCDENGQNTILGTFINVSGLTETFTIPEITTSKYLALWLYGNVSKPTEVGDYIDYINIKVCKGNKIEGYSPFGQGSLVIFNTNKNLAEINKKEWDLTNQGIKNKSQNNGSKLCQFELKKGQTVNISLKLISRPKEDTTLSFYNNNEIDDLYGFIGIQRNFKLNNVYTRRYTAKEDCIISYKMWGNPNSDIFEFQFWAETEKVTNYKPHQSQTKTLHTQQPFRMVGETRDSFIKKEGKWYEEHKIFRKIFNGTETINIIEENDSNGILTNLIKCYTYEASDINNKKENANDVIAMSNYFEGTTFNDKERVNIVYGTSDSSTRTLVMTTTEITTVADFKTKLTELYDKGEPLYIDYVLEEPLLIPCTPAQSIMLESSENIQLYDGINHFYSKNNVPAMLTLEKYYIIDDYDLYISSDGFFVIPGTDIKLRINLMESSLPSMPEAVESSVRAAGRDGDYVLKTTYEPIPFEIVCYTEDNLTANEKKEMESKINVFLNSIKNKTKRMAFEKDDKFYNVKYNNLITTTNYPAHLKFGIPLKSSESYGKDILEKTIVGNNSETSNTIEPVGALITINGPATLPIISLNDYPIEYNSAITEGARIEIDTNKSTINYINIYGVKTNVMKFYNHQFPKIENGKNTLKILSGIDNEYNVNIKWNDLKL